MMRAALAGLLATACGAPPCVEVSADCEPLFEPTFDEIHARTLAPTCAAGGCHSGDSPRAGLDLSPREAAYDALKPYTEGDDLGCVVLIRWLHAEDPDAGMPPGAPLDDAELCAIRQWVAAGAPR